MSSLRIGIIGARRHVQGLGPYLARYLAAAGAEICGIVGTTDRTLAEACQQLQTDYGLKVRGYLDMAQMIERERLEAVAICSPYRFHQAHLQTALAHRQHVLCEKPLVFQPDRDNVADAQVVVEGFRHAGRVLMVNHQWPYTLSGFARCYPDLRPEDPLRRLEVLLAPAREGIAMIPDAVPHVASLLLALAPGEGQAEHVRCTPAASGPLQIAFDYVHAEGAVEVQVDLVHCPHPPRPAAYAINDCTVVRRIAMPAYQLYLQPVAERPGDLAGQDPRVTPPAEGCFPLEDPLQLLAADFIRRVAAGGNAGQDPLRLVQNVRLVQQAYEAARQVLSG